MGVVYFSIIPTFEPSRYCKCWIVCFYHIKELYNKKEWTNQRIRYVRKLYSVMIKDLEKPST